MPKKPSKPQTSAAPPPPRSKMPLVLGIVVVVVVVAGAFAMMRSTSQTDANAAAPAATSSESAAQRPTPRQADATPASDEVPATAKFGPHTQASYPPLPDTGFPPPRPMSTVNAVYQFAAEHPEVLSYIPCYCGCERQGHKGNDDCFVARRGATGDVEAWDSHGMT